MLVVPAVLVALTCGALVAAQGQLNGDLSSAGAGALVASWFSYVGTLLTALLVVVVRGSARSTARLLRREGRWWWYAVGLCGIPVVLAMSAGVPIVGVALASVCSVAGQTVSGLALDARGVGLDEPLRMSARRLTAGAMALAGLGVAVLAGSTGLAASVGLVAGTALLLFVGGVALGGQQAGNGAVTRLAGDAVVAGVTSALGGTAGITVLLAVVGASGGLADVALPADPVLYLGGPLGAGITIGAAWAVRHLGTFALTLAVVGGQMATAVLIDLFGGVGLHGATLDAAALIAAATGVAVGRRRGTVPSPG